MTNNSENTATNRAMQYDALLASFIVRAVQEDVVIKQLTNELSRTYAHAIPTLIVSDGGKKVEQKYNGFVEAIATDIKEQIEFRKQQIINFYERG